MSGLVFENVYGKDAEPYLQELARLRILVFRAFPYLYEGSLAYEEGYLRTYFKTPESLVVLAKAGDKIVGASTAIPLKAEDASLKKPFLDRQINPERVMYFGESILLPEYRGQGAGKIFFKRRLRHAESFPMIDTAAFCAVIRATDHPHRPSDYQPLDSLWEAFDFRPAKNMIGHLTWLDRGESHESAKPMQFWLRTLGKQHEQR